MSVMTKIILLCTEGESTTFVYNALKDKHPISHIVYEEKIDKKTFLKRRVKRLGYLRVIGQAIFQLTIPKILQITSKKRIEEIKHNYGLNDTPILDESIIKQVRSINSKECIEFLKQEKPDLIIVNGTRIISKKVLNGIGATFINMHAGITPKYRGVHGGYWAMVNKDVANCGVTVHLVDSGIDTGGVLFQRNIVPNAADNFVTYPYLQTAEGTKLMVQAITDFSNGCLKEKEVASSKSHLWYHPTIWYYLYIRLTKGIR